MCKHSVFKTSLKGPLKETVMCKYSAFKGACSSNASATATREQRRPKQGEGKDQASDTYK